VPPKRRLTHDGAKKLGDRERSVGLDPTDDAARWLAEHDPPAPLEVPKGTFKSKELHRWRQRQTER
jgi:hypothetical protein